MRRLQNSRQYCCMQHAFAYRTYTWQITHVTRHGRKLVYGALTHACSYPDVDPLEDLNTELERKLGTLVKAKYGTDFYILYRFPQKVRCGLMGQVTYHTLHVF